MTPSKSGGGTRLSGLPIHLALEIVLAFERPVRGSHARPPALPPFPKTMEAWGRLGKRSWSRGSNRSKLSTSTRDRAGTCREGVLMDECQARPRFGALRDDLRGEPPAPRRTIRGHPVTRSPGTTEIRKSSNESYPLLVVQETLPSAARSYPTDDGRLRSFASSRPIRAGKRTSTSPLEPPPLA